MIEFFVLLVSSALLFFIKILDKNPPPLFGIYQQPNGFYWLKVCFMYALLSLRKVTNKLKKRDAYYYFALESPHKLSNHEGAIDAVYFNGANKNGDHLVVGTARRKNRLVDAFLYLKINSSELGVLETPNLPNTSLYQNEDCEKFVVEGIHVEMLEFMKKWKVAYKGKLKGLCKETNQYVYYDVEIDGLYTSDLPEFNFDTDMDPLAMAKSMAFEKWSRDYFKQLEENHQTHYEQFGTLDVSINIENKGSYKIRLDTLRDHSFGTHRDWRQFYRYALHFGTTEYGDHFSLGTICMPVSFSRLTLGYIYSAKHKKIYPVRSTDLHLYQHGHSGDQPRDFAFSFYAGGHQYTLEVEVVDQPYFYISKDWEAKVYEGLCKFKLNGKKGWGAAEWEHRNVCGKDVPDHQICTQSVLS